MSTDEHYKAAIKNLSKGREVQKDMRENTPSFLPTAQNKYYIEYQRWKTRCYEARQERDNARIMVDALLRCIGNIMPGYQESLRYKIKHGERLDRMEEKGDG